MRKDPNTSPRHLPSSAPLASGVAPHRLPLTPIAIGIAIGLCATIFQILQSEGVHAAPSPSQARLPERVSIVHLVGKPQRSPAITGPATEVPINPGENGATYEPVSQPRKKPRPQKLRTYSWFRDKTR